MEETLFLLFRCERCKTVTIRPSSTPAEKFRCPACQKPDLEAKHVTLSDLARLDATNIEKLRDVLEELSTLE